MSDSLLEGVDGPRDIKGYVYSYEFDTTTIKQTSESILLPDFPIDL